MQKPALVDYADTAEILEKHRAGMPLKEAFDEVVGEGALDFLVQVLREELLKDEPAEVPAKPNPETGDE